MRIGVPKESKFEERRVALTPAGVDSLVKSGHVVYVQSGAGEGSHFDDENYKKVGAQIVYSPDEVYHRSEIISRVSVLTEEDIPYIQENQVIFSFLHLAITKKKIVQTLLERKAVAIGYELIEDYMGAPILQSMSEIAGQLCIQVGEQLLKSYIPVSRGILMSGITGVAPASVVILGAGVVGTAAARAALDRGAHVVVLDKDLHRLRKVDEVLNRKVTTVVANPSTIARGVKYADVFIGAVHVKGHKAPHVVTEENVKTMKKGAVIIDVAIDQGGCIETSRPTTISNPFFVTHDVIHYCVPNMTALVARTASMGITNALLPYLHLIADSGLESALMEDVNFVKGVCTYNGYCTNESIAEAFNTEYRRIVLFPNN